MQKARAEEMSELAAKSFSVVEYTNSQGSRVIAVLDKDAYWNVLCMASTGAVHYFKWDHAKLTFDAGEASVDLSTR